MISIIAADLQCILKKKGFWIASLVIIFISCFAMQVELIPDDGLRGFFFLGFSVNVFKAAAIFFGFLIFTMIVCLICYPAVCVTAIHFTFGKKKLSF